MTKEHGEAEPKPPTQQFPVVQPYDQAWRHTPATIRPVEEAEEVSATQRTPAPDQDTAESHTPLRKPPFKDVRFSFDDPIVTATFYVDEGVRRNKDFRKKEKHLTVIKNGATDTDLIAKLDFIPEDGEDEIRYLERRHWMYFGSVAIPHVFLWLVGSILYVIYRLDRYIGNIGLIILGVWLLLWLAHVGITLMHWYFVYILITNTRLHAIRNYPIINLPVQDQHLIDIGETTIKPLLVRLFGLDYARLTGVVIGSGSAGETAEWLTKRGFSYLKHPRVLQSITRPS